MAYMPSRPAGEMRLVQVDPDQLKGLQERVEADMLQLLERNQEVLVERVSADVLDRVGAVKLDHEQTTDIQRQLHAYIDEVTADLSGQVKAHAQAIDDRLHQHIDEVLKERVAELGEAVLGQCSRQIAEMLPKLFEALVAEHPHFVAEILASREG